MTWHAWFGPGWQGETPNDRGIPSRFDVRVCSVVPAALSHPLRAEPFPCCNCFGWQLTRLPSRS